MITNNLNFILDQISDKEIYLSLILSNPTQHSILNEAIAVYIVVIPEHTGFLIPISHPEESVVNIKAVEEVLKKVKRIFVTNKKEYLYFFNTKNVYDIHFSLDYENENIGITRESTYYNWLNRKHNNFSEINKIIPLVKHLETCSNEYILIKEKVNNILKSEFNLFFNNTATNVFYLIEQHGLKILYEPFFKLFKPNSDNAGISNNIVYTSYNLYNITSRPTNTFNGVNFAAIPKKLEYRKCFIPQNDIFVEFDFDGYHIRLLAEQVGYALNSEPAHTQLARLYFNKNDISPEEYTMSKQINFQALYGNVPNEHRDFELFKLIENWTNELWSEFTYKGSICTPISNKCFTNKIEGMYPKKLLNYTIQALETARNITVLKNVLQFLDKKKTKVALYTYDSVLVDLNKADGKETLEELESILSENNRYPVKFKYSNNLVFD